jgi:hypothetical protein
MSSYLIHGRPLSPDDAGFATALAAAHAKHQRPLCLCNPDGVEMYVARLGRGHQLKRMPGTGGLHVPGCPSYEPPADASDAATPTPVAIQGDAADGTTALVLGFPLARADTRAAPSLRGPRVTRAPASSRGLTLLALLHYLWNEAELTHWQPAFAGRRTWGTVRRHLLRAAAGKTVHGEALLDRLYVPEVFSVAQRDAIDLRRRAQWALKADTEQGARPLMLLIGEAKEIMPTRSGGMAIVKHVPDERFTLDGRLYRDMEQRFGRELRLWGSGEALHMMLIATFRVISDGGAAIDRLAMMPVTAQWLPVHDLDELQLVERLVREERCFVFPPSGRCAGSRASLAPFAVHDRRGTSHDRHRRPRRSPRRRHPGPCASTAR